MSKPVTRNRAASIFLPRRLLSGQGELSTQHPLTPLRLQMSLFVPCAMPIAGKAQIFPGGLRYAL